MNFLPSRKPLKIQEVQDNKTIPTLMDFVYEMSANLPEERSELDIHWHNNNICSGRKEQCRVLIFRAQTGTKVSGISGITQFWFCFLWSWQMIQVTVRGKTLCKTDYGCDRTLCPSSDLPDVPSMSTWVSPLEVFLLACFFKIPHTERKP